MTIENPAAFPMTGEGFGSAHYATWQGGMTLRDYFAGQALANPTLCTGKADERDLQRWFGGRCGIERWEVAAKQAGDYAAAMLAARQDLTS
jgi:hypothetical protein